MMKYKLFVLQVLAIAVLFNMTNICADGQINEYIKAYEVQGLADFELEQDLVRESSCASLLSSLLPYAGDTSLIVRQKVYELLYRKGVGESINNQSLIVDELMSACMGKDISTGIRCMRYLQSFPVEAFNVSSRHKLEQLLEASKNPFFKESVLLAGYLSIGKESLQRKLLLADDYTYQQIWYMHLALARMGIDKSLEHCINTATRVDDGNDKVAYVLPDLIYTRQKKAIDYCIEILNDDSNNCSSPDPDKDEMICCGYRVMELLAPIIDDFPYIVDDSGTLDSDDYSSALTKCRAWFKGHPNYMIKTSMF